jgi:hypothetical protein
MTDRSTAPTDARNRAPAAPRRLHGADRSGLGEKGWAEVPESNVGHPDDTNVEPEYYEPMPTKLRRKEQGTNQRRQ